MHTGIPVAPSGGLQRERHVKESDKSKSSKMTAGYFITASTGVLYWSSFEASGPNWPYRVIPLFRYLLLNQCAAFYHFVTMQTADLLKDLRSAAITTRP